MNTQTPPLNDPTYAPVHPPIKGDVPAVVEKWGAASQVRWFDRFRGTINPRPHSEWARFYVDSMLHKGLCCDSCQEDGEWESDHCCCLAEHRGPVRPD